MTNFAKAKDKMKEYGTVEQVRHSIAYVRGLPDVHLDEKVYFDNDEPGRVLALKDDIVQIAQLKPRTLHPGQQVARTGEELAMQVGDAQRGQVVNPLGESIIGGITLSGSLETRSIDSSPLPLERRQRLSKPFITGSTIVDMLVPLTAGQREAVFGDQKTGKTSFLLATARAHAKKGIVVYGLIGRPASDLKRVYEFMRDDQANSQNVIVVASLANDTPSLIDLTPAAAMTVAEYWRDQGDDVLLVLHDLSSHAKFHREIALIAGRFPGRESYPGDIFYEHARLLERAGNFSVRLGNTGKVTESSITCLPVVETVSEELGSYIVSNIISITDGHLMFDRTNYSQGQRPAVKPTSSVTRIGLKTRTDLFKKFHRQLLAHLGEYQRALRFSHFGSELSEKLKNSMTIGERLQALFAQPINLNVPQPVQLVLTAMIWQGWYNDLKTTKITAARNRLVSKYQSSPKVKKYVDSLCELPDIEGFLSTIDEHKEELLSLCQTTKI